MNAFLLCGFLQFGLLEMVMFLESEFPGCLGTPDTVYFGDGVANYKIQVEGFRVVNQTSTSAEK